MSSPAPIAPSATAPVGIRLGLLGTFEATVDGEVVALPMSAQRVLAFLALHGRSLLRSFVAGSLWLESTDDKAAGSLRSSLWRVNRDARFVEANGEQLRLHAGVAVDLDDATEQAQRLLDPSTSDCPSLNRFLMHDDLLPDWYDDWVAIERERYRQLRVHALEQLCERLLAAERFGEASEAGHAAVRIEPLRESAHRLVVRVHLAEGNESEALRHYNRFRDLLAGELALAPSAKMTALVEHLTRW